MIHKICGQFLIYEYKTENIKKINKYLKNQKIAK
jgi:hypothetical protein